MSESQSLLPRLKAGGAHLGISICIALAAIALIFLVWYPEPLAQTQGVGRLVLLLIGVDVVIGPCITLIIFDRAKKSLPFDLAIVAFLQLGALTYGLHSIFTARPAYIAFNIDRFDVVAALDVDETSLQEALAAGKADLPLWGPQTVFAKLPEDRNESKDILFSAVFGGSDLPQMPQWYEPYGSGKEDILKKMRPLDELRAINHMTSPRWEAFLAALGRPPEELGYLPLRAKIKDGAVIVDAQTAEIVQISLLEPKWD